jgi:hypothetical protein
MEFPHGLKMTFPQRTWSTYQRLSIAQAAKWITVTLFMRMVCVSFTVTYTCQISAWLMCLPSLGSCTSPLGASTHTHRRTHTHTHTDTHTDTRTDTHIDTQTHTHRHTQSRLFACLLYEGCGHAAIILYLNSRAKQKSVISLTCVTFDSRWKMDTWWIFIQVRCSNNVESIHKWFVKYTSRGKTLTERRKPKTTYTNK